jgi:hypothetical protein
VLIRSIEEARGILRLTPQAAPRPRGAGKLAGVNERSFTEASCSRRVRDTRRGYGAHYMDLSTNNWSRRTALSLLVPACVFPLAVLCPSTSGATKFSNSASQLLKTTIASATQRGSVHVTVHFFSGNKTGEVVEDSALQSGVETVAIGQERVSIVLADGNAYVTGNRQGLLSYMGLPASMATALADQWISIPPTDRGFTSVISGLTLSSALHQVTPAGSISQGKQKTVNGQSTISVSGTGSTGQAKTSLFIATKGARLPVEAVAATGNGKAVSGEIVTFARWGESVHTPKPATSVPISSLRAGSASSG